MERKQKRKLRKATDNPLTIKLRFASYKRIIESMKALSDEIRAERQRAVK